jgi:soluble lytic murein transglycosylase
LAPVFEIFFAVWSSVFGAQASGPVVGVPPPAISTPPLGYRTSQLSYADAQALQQGLRAAANGDLSGAESDRLLITDPVAQKIVLWAEVDQLGDRMSFLQLDAARRDLSGWPRPNTRQAKAEKALETAVYDPDRTIAWFDGVPPQTPEGAIALAGALQARGRVPEAQALIKHWWRDRLFDADTQARMAARFGAWLGAEDHAKRLDTLLLGPQGPAAQAMLALVDEDHRALARAAIALRSDSRDATALVNVLPASLTSDPAVAFERARYLRRHGLDELGFGLVADFPSALEDEDIAEKLWIERKGYYNSALRARNWAVAYAAMDKAGFPPSEHRAETEFFAGWIALTKLHDYASADAHFAAVASAGASPITRARSDYWRGRTAEARGDSVAAQAFYQSGAQHLTTFYGQLSAEKAGLKTLTLGADPVPTEADRQRFDARETVRAARMLREAGLRDSFRAFVLSIAATLPKAEEYVLLVDLARDAGDPDLALRVVRAGAQRGFILPGRGYPMPQPPNDPGDAEPAFVLSITRQESNFYSQARSGANARGMMQLLPGTARRDAAQLGLPYSESRLWEPEYNMRIGAYELGQMVATFGGSYAMAAAAYNAGPNRPPQWVLECGDPRATGTDPLDFVECIPFTETRNYVMRTLETMEVYRAKLNGGATPLTLAEDLKRGVYGYMAAPVEAEPLAPVAYDQLIRSDTNIAPREVSTHSASKWKTRRKVALSKASRKHPSATRHPSSSTRTRSTKRAHKPRS